MTRARRRGSSSRQVGAAATAGAGALIARAANTESPARISAPSAPSDQPPTCWSSSPPRAGAAIPVSAWSDVARPRVPPTSSRATALVSMLVSATFSTPAASAMGASATSRSGDVRHERPGEQRRAQKGDAREDQRPLREPPRERSDRDALDQHGQHADVGEHVAWSAAPPGAGALLPTARTKPGRCRRRARRTSRVVSSGPTTGRRSAASRADAVTGGRGFSRELGPSLRRQAFGQRREHPDEVHDREPGRGEGRHRDAPPAEESSRRRPDDEPDPERGADDAEALRAVLLVGDVGDVRLGEGDVAAEEPVERHGSRT